MVKKYKGESIADRSDFWWLVNLKSLFFIFNPTSPSTLQLSLAGHHLLKHGRLSRTTTLCLVL
jgi:hypothetical protein